MTRVTMQTIAEQLGVSKDAVSRSLAGKDGVSEATRRTVERVAQELGYVAPSLMTGARTIQLILHDHDPVNSEVQLRIQRGIQREAERHGYPVQLQWTHEPRRIRRRQGGQARFWSGRTRRCRRWSPGSVRCRASRSA